MSLRGVGDFVDALQGRVTIESVEECLRESLCRLGFDKLAYVVIRPVPGILSKRRLTTYPGEWVDHYLEHDYDYIDATFAAAAKTTLPFRWDAPQLVAHRTPRQTILHEEAKDFGIVRGLTVPLHGPQGGLAALSMAADMSVREFDRTWRAKQHDLFLMAAYTHETVIRIVQKEVRSSPATLTERERECLSWTAQGKTTWEISQILAISNETVRFHIKNAMSKFGVFSKHHAVVAAIMRGLIMP